MATLCLLVAASGAGAGPGVRETELNPAGTDAALLQQGELGNQQQWPGAAALSDALAPAFQEPVRHAGVFQHAATRECSQAVALLLALTSTAGSLPSSNSSLGSFTPVKLLLAVARARSGSENMPFSDTVSAFGWVQSVLQAGLLHNSSLCSSRPLCSCVGGWKELGSIAQKSKCILLEWPLERKRLA